VLFKYFSTGGIELVLMAGIRGVLLLAVLTGKDFSSWLFT